MAFDTEMCEVPADEESIHDTTTAWNAESQYTNDNDVSKHGSLNTSAVFKRKNLQTYNLTCNQPMRMSYHAL